MYDCIESHCYVSVIFCMRDTRACNYSRKFPTKTRPISDLGTYRKMSGPAKLICDALAMAYFTRKPAAGLILHSDRGVQYASHTYRTQLAQY